MAASCPKCGHPLQAAQPPQQQWAPPPGQWPQQAPYPQQGYPQQHSPHGPYQPARGYTPAQAEMKSASTQVALWGLGIAGAFFGLAVVVALLGKCGIH